MNDSWAKVLVAIDDEDVLAEGEGLEGELLEGEGVVLLAAFLSEETSEGKGEAFKAGQDLGWEVKWKRFPRGGYVHLWDE